MSSKTNYVSYKTMPRRNGNHALSPNRGRISIVLPKESTNKVLNPAANESFYLANIGSQYVALGSTTISYERNISRRNHGSFCVAPSIDSSGGIALPVTTEYGYNSFSVDIVGGLGSTFEIGFMDQSGIIKQSETITATGYWQRVGVTHFSPFGNEECLVFVRRSAPFVTTCNFYVDGWQVECSEEPTTYIDGASGFGWCGVDCFYSCDGVERPYSWNGQAFSSESTRHRLTHSGGQVINLDDVGFITEAIEDAAMPPTNTATTPYAQIDGSSLQSLCYTENSFSIRGAFAACNCSDSIHMSRAEFINLVRQSSRRYREPLLLRYQEFDECGNPCGRELETCVIYEDGLQGSIGDRHVEDGVEISFVQPDPFWYEVGLQADVFLPDTSLTEQEFEIEVCNRGNAPSAPVFQASGPFAIESICSIDTGDTISFFDDGSGIYTINYPDLMNINTHPINGFANVGGDPLGGYVAGGSALRTFELLPGKNTIRVKLINMTQPAIDPANPITPFFRVLHRPAFFGIDHACVRNDCDVEVCEVPRLDCA